MREVGLDHLCSNTAVTLREALRAAVARLTAGSVPSPRLNAELLIMFVLGCDRAYLHAHSERELSADEQALYDQALGERARGVPAQYITGHQEFWGMDFIVSQAVLIPRPETEHVIEKVLEIVRVGRLPSPATSLRIADVGTGSGCIALALARELRSVEIHAADISAAALEVARANAARHQLAGRVQFHHADLLGKLETAPKLDPGMNLDFATNIAPNAFDLIVSNPPYVGESEEDQVQLEVRKFEPRGAVFAGPTGLEVIARLIPQGFATLKAGGWLVMEISGTIAGAVRELMKDWEQVEITPDLQGIPRVISGQKHAAQNPLG